MNLDALRTVIHSVIGQLSKPAVLQRTIKGAYTPQTGASAADVVTTYALRVTPPMSADFRNREGSLIQSGDLIVQIADLELTNLELTLTPQTDKILLDGITWTIVSHRPIYTQTLIGMHEVVLRR